MKKEISPLAIAGVVVVAVVLLGIFGYRMLQPAPYVPSPGASGASGQTPGAPASAKAPASSTYYPSAPAGSIPGKPPGSTQ